MITLEDFKNSSSGYSNYIEKPSHEITNISKSVTTEQYVDSLMAFIEGAYESAKDISCNNDIIMEAATDSNKVSTKVFTEIKIQYGNMVEDIKNKNIRDLKTAVDKYRKIVTNQTIMNRLKNVTFKGFNYNIKNDYISTEPVLDIMYKAEVAMASVENATSEPSSIVNSYCNMIGTDAQFARFRGMLVDKNMCPGDRYGDELFKYFRSGAGRPSDITFKEDNIYELKWVLKDLHDALENCNTDFLKIRELIDTTIKFVNTQPVVLADNLSIMKAQALDQPFVKEKKLLNDDNSVKYYRSEKYNAFSTIFTRTNISLRECIDILNKFVVAKLKAIRGAIVQYDKYFSMILDVKPTKESVDVRTWYDYLDESLDSYDDVYYRSLLESATRELHTLTTALYTNKLLFEAGGVEMKSTNVAANRAGSGGGIFGALGGFIKSILNFISGVLTKFTDNMKGLQGVAQQLSNDVQYLKNIPQEVLKDMTLTYPDFIDTKAQQRLMNHDIPISQKNFDVIAEQISSSNITADKVYQQYFKELYRINPNDYKEASTRYYRGHDESFTAKLTGTNNPGGQHFATAKGLDCQEKINAMLDYCMNLKPYADSARITLENLRKKIANHANQLDKLRREQRGIEVDKARAQGAQNNNQQITARPGKIQGNIPAVAQTQQIMQNARPVTNSFSPTFSILEGVPIEESIYRPYLVDHFGIPIVELTSKGLLQANASVGTSNVVRPMNNQPAQQTQQPVQQQSSVQVQNNQQAQKPQQNQQQARDYDKELTTNQQSQAKAKAIQQVYHIAATVATSKLSVTENMFKEYAKILNNVVAVVKRYHGIQADKAQQAENAENVKKGREAELNTQKHRTAMAKERQKTINATKPRRGLLKLAKDALW